MTPSSPHVKATQNPLTLRHMNSPSALSRYVVTSLTALWRMRWHSIRSRAVLLILVALLNIAQGIVCNLHDVSHISIIATETTVDGAVNFSHDHDNFPADPSDPLDIDAHCLHIGCVHSPAFAATPISHEFLSALNTAPTSGAQLNLPMPPLGSNFRPPRQI